MTEISKNTMSNNRRVLRTYERTAQQEHYCTRCQSPITGGELYRGVVTVHKGEYGGKKRSWVEVKKDHSEMQDCYDWELDLEIHMAEDTNREREEEAKKSLTLLTLLAGARTRRI